MGFTHTLTADEKATLTAEELADYDKWEKLNTGQSIEPELNEDGTPKETTPKVEEVIPPVTPAPVVEPPKPEEPDYRKKFGESTRRNQVVESQFSELQKILGDITKQEVPTDDEMKAQVPDWEFLSEREKNGERKLLVLERRQNLMMKTFSNISSETENLKKLESFIYNEPKLKGKEDDFIAFVEKPANKGASMEVLLNAFLFEVKPEETPTVTPPADEIAPSLERGTPSGNMPPINTGKKEYSDEELASLRKNDPKKYHELIRKGLI